MKALRFLIRFFVTCGFGLAGMALALLFSPALGSLLDTGVMGGMMFALIVGSIVGSATGCVFAAGDGGPIRLKALSVASALGVSAVGAVILVYGVNVPREWERPFLLLLFTVGVPLTSLCGFHMPMLFAKRMGPEDQPQET
jgi:hypothetical protein